MTTKTASLLLIIVPFFSACHRNTDMGVSAEAAGVPLALAKHRKATISQVQYTINVNIPLVKKDAIGLLETVNFNLSDTANPVLLDFKEKSSNLTSVEVNGKSTPVIHQYEHLVIPKELLIKGRNIVKIKGKAGETSLNRNEEYLYTLLVPERARTFFPCFDQPDIKAIFSVSVTGPSDWEFVSNAPLDTTIAGSGSAKVCMFEPSDTISTYLFSLVAGKFKKETRSINNREMNFYYRETDPERIKESIDSVFDWHKRTLDFMEDYTGIKYPFKKLDIVAVPDFTFSGMEHVGAIDYKPLELFLDKNATLDDRIGRAYLIAHEVAHMWFGNLVTMKWFNDVWMKEVFANFMADKITQSVVPEATRNFQFMLEHYPAAYYVDRTEGSNPIRQQLDNLDQAGTMYGDIIYHKAPIVMRQLERITGKSIMQKGLADYLKRYSFGNADWDDLVNILDEKSEENIQSWNEQWIKKSGRPVISYSLRESNGQVKELVITQKPEYGREGTWTQFFTIGLAYDDEIKLLPVHLDRDTVVLDMAKGMPLPRFVLLNATSEGYGSFAIDSNMLSHINSLKQPASRTSAYLNIYEKTLDGKGISPSEMLLLYAKNLRSETETILITRITRQLRNIYWQFISPETRQQIVKQVESDLWQAVLDAKPENKKEIFLAYSSIALSKDAMDNVYNIWATSKNTYGIPLSEDDQIGILTDLVIKQHPKAGSMLKAQSGRIKDEDRKAGFEFIFPALSNDVKERDDFFESLADRKNRAKEPLVINTLNCLHHPLRAKDSEKYLHKTLELLEEIQITGAIFFPTNWLRASFGYYQSESAARIVKNFLDEHPGYNRNLKTKILQETDDLMRAVKILGK
jgi:aminopeptidase N